MALKLGRLDEALPELEMAVRLAPTDERAWSYLGYAYAKKGEVVEAAAAFRRAKQDALATELEHAAKVRRPATPSFHFGHVTQLQRSADTGVRDVGAARAAPSAEEPPPASPRRAKGGAAPDASAAREASAAGPAAGLLFVRAGDARDPAEMSGIRGPIALAPPLPPPSAAESAAPAAPVELAAPLGDPTSPPLEATPVSLLAFVLSRLGQSPAPTLPVGPLRLAVADEIHVRRDAVLAGSGALEWQPAVRRAQGRRGAELLGTPAGPFFRLTGSGEVWVAGARSRWLPVALTEDVLYVREDRVLAFDGQVSWEAGTVPGVGVRMLQFRGRGTVALELEEAPLAIKVTEDRPTLLAASRLVGWVGRLVPYGAPLEGGAPFQLACQGEGVVLLDAEKR